MLFYILFYSTIPDYGTYIRILFEEFSPLTATIQSIIMFQITQTHIVSGCFVHTYSVVVVQNK